MEASMKRAVEKAFRESAEVKLKFLQEYADRIVQVTELILDTYRQGHKLLFFGNGGSATDASHLAAELVNRYRRDREGLPAIALTTDMSVITSIGNDSSYNEIFARQVQALGKKGDIAVAISTSGNSPNVLRGVEEAKKKGITTVGFTGGTGGKLVNIVDHFFLIPSKNTARIQETHITLGHIICEMIEDHLFGEA
jgi:D-sedoheptulose 7-phosphate isomerase